MTSLIYMMQITSHAKSFYRFNISQPTIWSVLNFSAGTMACRTIYDYIINFLYPIFLRKILTNLFRVNKQLRRAAEFVLIEYRNFRDKILVWIAVIMDLKLKLVSLNTMIREIFWMQNIIYHYNSIINELVIIKLFTHIIVRQMYASMTFIIVKFLNLKHRFVSIITKGIASLSIAAPVEKSREI